MVLDPSGVWFSQFWFHSEDALIINLLTVEWEDSLHRAVVLLVVVLTLTQNRREPKST